MANLSSSVKAVLHVAETKNDGNPTILGDGAVDAVGWRWATFLLGLGAVDTTVDAKVQESDDGATGWVDVTGAAITQLGADDDGAAVAIEVNLASAQGRKRYLKLLVTVGSGATGAALAVWCVLSAYVPSAAQQAPSDLAEVVAA